VTSDALTVAEEEAEARRSSPVEQAIAAARRLARWSKRAIRPLQTPRYRDAQGISY
jgi:hypothetical protein